jgi:hypothetical protein
MVEEEEEKEAAAAARINLVSSYGRDKCNFDGLRMLLFY